MENIINKAIEGGYPNAIYQKSEPNWVNDTNFKLCILDPLFWRALGKACGWRDTIYSYYYIGNGYGGTGYWRLVDTLEDVPKYFVEQQKKYPNAHWVRSHLIAEPQSHLGAIEFYKINLTQGFEKAVEYLEDLIKDNT